jgi:hypothetical protein
MHASLYFQPIHSSKGKHKTTESNQACVCGHDALKNLETNFGKENMFTSLEVMY